MQQWETDPRNRAERRTGRKWKGLENTKLSGLLSISYFRLKYNFNSFYYLRNNSEVWKSAQNVEPGTSVKFSFNFYYIMGKSYYRTLTFLWETMIQYHRQPKYCANSATQHKLQRLHTLITCSSLQELPSTLLTLPTFFPYK